MLGEILTGTKLAETLFKWGRSVYRVFRPVNEEEQPTITSRFIQLFVMHGVHANQIPEFFGYGITLADISKPDQLIDKLTEEVISAVVELFGVRKSWLQCVDDHIYESIHFGYQPQLAKEFIEELVDRNERVSATLLMDSEHHRDTCDVLIFHIPIGELEGLEIYRHIVINEHTHAYWKSMISLLALISISDSKDIFIDGYLTKPECYESLSNLKCTYSKAAKGTKSKYFNPEDLLESPDNFLKWVDEQEKGYGHRSATERYQQYVEAGWISVG